jgi:hypothetical protein
MSDGVRSAHAACRTKKHGPAVVQISLYMFVDSAFDRALLAPRMIADDS